MVERASRLLALLPAEYSLQRRHLDTVRTKLSAERDEARQEVGNAEAMFADLHRSVDAFSDRLSAVSERESVRENDYRWWTEDGYLQCWFRYP